jgi:Carboxypeptidase regulatory-like domain
MNGKHRIAVVIPALLLVAAGVLYSGGKVSAASGGEITGTVKLDGVAPHQKPIDMSKEPSCAAVHKDKPVSTEIVVANPSGGLEWVVVYISEGLNAAESSAVPSAAPSFDQKGCQYIPHVLPLDVNQHFKVVNSDQTSHNIHPMPKPGGGNHEWNKSQPPGSPPFDDTWTAVEMIPVKCNIHPWMHGYMAVVKGPYAVSDGSGSYIISGVPPGSYTVTAWQEQYGTQTQRVTVAAGKATADFTFKAK